MHRYLAIAFDCNHIADGQAVPLKILRAGDVEHLKQFFQNLVVRHILPHGGQISIVGDLVMLRVGRFASTIQLPHRSKSFIEDFFVMPQLHHHINIAPCVQKLLRDVRHGFTVKILVPFLLHRPPHSSGAERAEDFGADVSLASSASFSSVEGRWSALSSSASAALSLTAS